MKLSSSEGEDEDEDEEETVHEAEANNGADNEQSFAVDDAGDLDQSNGEASPPSDAEVIK